MAEIKSFTQNNLDNKRYRTEILPVVRGAAEAGLELNDFDIPDEFRAQAEQDYELAASSFVDNLGKDVIGIKDSVVGMGQLYSEAPSKYAPAENPAQADVAGMEGLQHVLKSLFGNGGAERMAADTIEEPMRMMSDPAGEAHAHPLGMLMAALPALSKLKKLRKGKQLELPLDDAAKRHNGNGEIDLEETMDRKDSPFEKDLEIDDDSATDMEMSDDSKKGQLGRIPLKKRQITEEDLPEIKPLREEDYPEITPRGPAKPKPKGIADDLIKGYLDEDAPGMDEDTRRMIKDFLKFQSVDKPKGSAAGMSRSNDVKPKAPKQSDMGDTDFLWERQQSPDTRQAPGMRAAGPDDFDIDEVTPSKFDKEPKSDRGVEVIDWADDSDDVEDFMPVIKEQKVAITPKDVMKGFGGAADEAFMLAERAMKSGKPLTVARKQIEGVVATLEKRAGDLEAQLKIARNKARIAQGKGVAPDVADSRFIEKAQSELDAIESARNDVLDRWNELDSAAHDRKYSSVMDEVEEYAEEPSSPGLAKVRGKGSAHEVGKMTAREIEAAKRALGYIKK